MPSADETGRKARTQATAPASTASSAATGARRRHASGAAAATASSPSAGEMPPFARVDPSMISAAAAAAARGMSPTGGVEIDTAQTLPRHAPSVIGRADGIHVLVTEYGGTRRAGANVVPCAY